MVAIDTSTVMGLRDRAVIGSMIYSLARVSAVTGMKVKDYVTRGRRTFFRLHEKGGKVHEVPVHHKAEEYLDEYLDVAGIEGQREAPLFRSTYKKTGRLMERGMSRNGVSR